MEGGGGCFLFNPRSSRGVVEFRCDGGRQAVVVFDSILDLVGGVVEF